MDVGLNVELVTADLAGDVPDHIVAPLCEAVHITLLSAHEFAGGASGRSRCLGHRWHLGDRATSCGWIRCWAPVRSTSVGLLALNPLLAPIVVGSRPGPRRTVACG